MDDEPAKPVEGMSEGEIVRLIEGQIAQTYDHFRMRQAWEHILSGPTSPKVIASALAAALSFGRYVPKAKAQPMHIHINIVGECSPDEFGKAISQALNNPV